MKLKMFVNKIVLFAFNRVLELMGLIIIIFAFFMFLSLISYSPEDPNFIFTDNSKISNIMGFRGSYTSDIILQSFGIISHLFPITFFFIGATIIKSKRLLVIIDNLFYLIIYSIIGTFYFSTFDNISFELTINGNGGFLGKYISNFLKLDLSDPYQFYVKSILLLLIVFSFCLSINFSIKFFKSLIKLLLPKIKKKSVTSYDSEINQQEDQNFDEVQDITENRKQEDLPFESNKIDKTKSFTFEKPKLEILNEPQKEEAKKRNGESVDEKFLEKILLDFGVEGKINKVNYGPVVTLNEFEPAAGVKVSKIINLSDDIARNTKSESARISTIPGSNTVGIELPNKSRENVFLREIISNSNFQRKEYKLPIALGKSISGVPIIGDLGIMPHLLIAGTTGSGKSVCINTIILSLLYRHTPEKCKFILIDPKMLELSTYEGIPHLLCPVITEAKKATSVLGWVVKEMESRYKLMTREGVRNIDGYNAKHKVLMPYIVVIVDEMSDLMHVAGKEIENYIQKLSQMARASGIHIIMATQRPSVDVITGTIKANFPTRISFQVSSKIDSRTILGEQGAEQLLGKGDMLYMSSANRIVRIHAPFVSDEEIEKVNDFLRKQAKPNYIRDITEFIDEDNKMDKYEINENKDELYKKALEIVKAERKASTSFLQRKLQIGYNRAARIMDMMEEEGEVGKANHVGKRDVLKWK